MSQNPAPAVDTRRNEFSIMGGVIRNYWMRLFFDLGLPYASEIDL